ncbi:MAG: type II toxin-antitoxin system Phd/YefM family antitoxin [Dehalococcoidia bacterium]
MDPGVLLALTAGDDGDVHLEHTDLLSSLAFSLRATAANVPACTLDMYTSDTGRYVTMVEVSVRDLRNRLRDLVRRAEAGEEIVILRRGRQVARIVPLSHTSGRLPDLSAFRASIAIDGEPLSETVIKERRGARY